MIAEKENGCPLFLSLKPIIPNFITRLTNRHQLKYFVL